MMNNDLISRNAAMTVIHNLQTAMGWLNGIHEIDIHKALLKIPAVDAEPVRHGRWIRPAFDPAWVKCSECGCYWEGGIVENCNMYYCPNCGCKMDAEVKNDGKERTAAEGMAEEGP